VRSWPAAEPRGKGCDDCVGGIRLPIVQRVGAVEHLRHPLGRLSAYIAHDPHADQ